MDRIIASKGPLLPNGERQTAVEMLTCEYCEGIATDEEAEMGWPIPSIDDGRLICPACFGDGGHCRRRGHVLPADVDSDRCPRCDAEEVAA